MRSIYAAHSWWLILLVVMRGATAVAQARLPQAADAGCPGAGVGAHYPAVNSPPITQVIRVRKYSAAPAGAACFDETTQAATWVTVASVVRTADSPNTVIRRFGAISELLTVKYWSTTDHKWRPLVSSASAIGGGPSTQPRADFAPAELATGDDRYYVITDTRSGRSVTYRLRLREAQSGRVVVETSNVDAIKEWGITLYAVGGLDTLYFLHQRSPGVWAYYSITRVLPASFLADGHEKSYLNRAVALYRHYMRLPTDTEPPPAP